MGRMITISVGAFLLTLVGCQVTPWTVLDKKVSLRGTKSLSEVVVLNALCRFD